MLQVLLYSAGLRGHSIWLTGPETKDIGTEDPRADINNFVTSSQPVGGRHELAKRKRQGDNIIWVFLSCACPFVRPEARRRRRRSAGQSQLSLPQVHNTVVVSALQQCVGWEIGCANH